jgi:hypothetical protein
MDALAIVLIASAVVSIVVVGVLFVWAARKDGEENDAVEARLRARQPGGRTRPLTRRRRQATRR